MKFWQTFHFHAVDRLLPLARMLEEQTLFHGAILGEHSLHYEKVEGSASNAINGEMPWPEETEWPDLGAAFGAMVAVTKRLHFSSSISILPLHHPFDVARRLATLSVISGNRVAIGVGLGWLEAEYRGMGIDYASRAKRYDEMLDVMRLLWRGGMVEYHGKHFDFSRARLNPTPAGHISIYLGGDSDVAVRRAAAKADGWISDGDRPGALNANIAKLRHFRREAGREKEPFEIIAYVDPNMERIKELRDMGVGSIFILPTLELQGPVSMQWKIDQSKRISDEIIAKL